jgi:predicted methyltransferase
LRAQGAVRRAAAWGCAALLPVMVLTVFADRIPAAEPVPAYIEAAVADPSRLDSDRQRDADRKPAEVIAFAGMKPGDKVADFMPGRGYFTRIFCKVVGDLGHVYAVTVPRPASAPPAQSAPPPSAPSQNTSSAAVAPEPAGQACTNVTTSSLKMRLYPAPELHDDSDPGWVYEYWSSSPAAENFTAPEPLDLIWTSENYHDLHNKAFGSPDMLIVNKALLAALRSGGILMIEDHAAAVGSAARDTDSLHRIAAEQVKREVVEAGFVFVGESKVLHHSDDPHTAKAHAMHDKTDRFLLKFRKP